VSICSSLRSAMVIESTAFARHSLTGERANRQGEPV
jgi:hypothetical protein